MDAGVKAAASDKAQKSMGNAIHLVGVVYTSHHVYNYINNLPVMLEHGGQIAMVCHTYPIRHAHTSVPLSFYGLVKV